MKRVFKAEIIWDTDETPLAYAVDELVVALNKIGGIEAVAPHYTEPIVVILNENERK